METTDKKSRIGVAISLDYRLGPSKNLGISSHVYQDDTVEDINKMVDKLAQVAARQQAIAELTEFYEALRIETKRQNEAVIALGKLQLEYPQKVQATNQALEDELGQIRLKFANYKTVQPQQLEKERNAAAKIDKLLAEMERQFQADTSNHKANILSLKDRVDDITASITKRERLINPDSILVDPAKEG